MSHINEIVSQDSNNHHTTSPPRQQKRKKDDSSLGPQTAPSNPISPLNHSNASVNQDLTVPTPPSTHVSSNSPKPKDGMLLPSSSPTSSNTNIASLPTSGSRKNKVKRVKSAGQRTKNDPTSLISLTPPTSVTPTVTDTSTPPSTSNTSMPHNNLSIPINTLTIGQTGTTQAELNLAIPQTSSSTSPSSSTSNLPLFTPSSSSSPFPNIPSGKTVSELALKSPHILLREKRMKLIEEFMTSELAHVESLKTVVIEYVQPLRNQLSKETLKRLFGNIEVIMGWNIQFYGRLRSRYEESEDMSVDSTNVEEHEFLFGDIMVEMLVILRQIYSQYNENYEEAQLTYRELMKNKEFEHLILQTSKGNSKVHLLTLLYLPVGRMIYYDQILKEIIAITPPDHPDREDLCNAHKMVGAATRQAGRVVEMRKNLHNVLRIQSMLQNADDIALPHRRYVFEGNLFIEVGSKTLKERTAFLFNDLIIIAKPKRKKFEVEWSSKLIQIQLIDDENDRKRFKLKDSSGQNEITLNSEEKPTWMYHISSAIKNLGGTPQELHALMNEEMEDTKDLDITLDPQFKRLDPDPSKFNDPKYFIDLILQWSDLKPEPALAELQETASRLRALFPRKPL